MLTVRALNRATLARQSLLHRTRRPAAGMLEQLIGVQAQAPLSPYVGLWTRLEGFGHEELSRLLTAREAVRGWLMRATVHLVTAADYRFLRPIAQPVLERSFAGQPFSKPLRAVALDDVLATGRAVLAAEPVSRSELGRRLAQRFPGLDPGALGMAVTYCVPVVQLPPRGVWGEPNRADAPLEELAVAPAPARGGLDTLVLRYLAAFGPATVKDIQQWSGLTRLREVTDRLGGRLVRHADGYLDVPDAPLPDPATPAPVRFLPEYDNLLLSHAVRTRFIADGRRGPLPPGAGARTGTVLIDGFYRADWKLEPKSLAVTPFQRLTPAEESEVEAEAANLLDFIAPSVRDIQFLAS